MREWLVRLADWFRRGRLDRELGDELQFHREQLEQVGRAAGAGPEEARRSAHRRLGSLTRYREEARDRWSWPGLEHFFKDTRYAIRGLRRSPGFTATVVLTLGLGIGANAAMFGAVDRLMLRPFPYLRDPASVHRVYLQTRPGTQTRTFFTIPYTRYLDLQRATTSFSHSAAFTEQRMALGTGAGARERLIAGVSASLFEFFDARPALGRFFTVAEDAVPLGAAVIVLSHSLWRTDFGGQNVLGQTLRVGTLPYTIIGVAPEEFVGAGTGEPPAAFVPITTVPANHNPWSANTYFVNYNWDWIGMLVRRKPGVSQEAASADLSMAYRKSRTAQRVFNPQVSPDSVARPQAVAGAPRTAAGPDAGLESRTLLWVTGVAVIVLLIACANVTNLMFARVLHRRREIAMRVALGVTRARLVAQLLAEGVVLALLGCGVGIAIAQWGSGALRLLVAGDGSAPAVYTDWRILGIAAVLALGAGLLTTIGPALLAMRGNLSATLRAGAREGTYRRSGVRSVLMVAQAALAVLLLVGAALFVRSLSQVRAMRMGYDAERVLRASPNFRGVVFDSAGQISSRRRLLAAAQAIPGVLAAARVSGTTPFFTSTTGLFVPGIDSVARLGRFNYQVATPEYFGVMGTRILRGRAFTAADREGTAPVVVVSESMARTLWPGKAPLGECIRVSMSQEAFIPGYSPAALPCTTVIGVAEDAVVQSMTNDQRLLYYLPIDQINPAWGNTILLRVGGDDPGALMETVRRELQRAMPGDGYVVVSRLESVLDAQRRSWQLGATMFVAFGVLALVVAAVGLYGVIGYDVAQRAHELGVRIALGAQSADVVKLVVGKGAVFAGAGVTVGLGAAFLVATWIQPLLFQQSARDPLIYGAVGGILLVVAIMASVVPAVRATRADPNTALRSD
jgi:putative ABC transport system permease protein